MHTLNGTPTPAVIRVASAAVGRRARADRFSRFRSLNSPSGTRAGGPNIIYDRINLSSRRCVACEREGDLQIYEMAVRLATDGDVHFNFLDCMVFVVYKVQAILG